MSEMWRVPGKRREGCRHCFSVIDTEGWQQQDAGGLGADERGGGHPLEDPPVGPYRSQGARLACSMACACLRSTSWSGCPGAVEGRPNPPRIGGELASTDLRKERRKRGSAVASVGRGPGLRWGFGTVTSTLPSAAGTCPGPQTRAAYGNGSDRKRTGAAGRAPQTFPATPAVGMVRAGLRRR
jgi:hypothetical protein